MRKTNHTHLARQGRRALAIAALTGAATFAAPAHAIPVDLELGLLADVSGSVSGAEFALQRDGYAAAFQDPGIQAAIASQPNGIAVSLIYWSSSTAQAVAVDWMQITDAASSNAFAAAVTAAPRPFFGSTAPGSAIAYATPLVLGNDYEGARLILDVSGDGTANGGVNTAVARDAALAAGIDRINGLVISPTPALEAFYSASVVGGPGAFLATAEDFEDFAEAITNKIGREIIVQVAEPSSLALLGLGLAGLAYTRRRVRSAR